MGKIRQRKKSTSLSPWSPRFAFQNDGLWIGKLFIYRRPIESPSLKLSNTPIFTQSLKRNNLNLTNNNYKINNNLKTD